MFDSFIHAALPFLQIATNSTVPPEAISGLTQQVNSNDTATAIMGFTGVAAGIGAVVKSVFTDKNQKTNQKLDDFDNEKQRELMNIENNYTLKFPEKTRAQILALPAYPESPALTKTLAQAYAEDYEDYKEYNIKTYYQKK